MSRIQKGFFWGAPSHKSTAWVGAAAGLLVLVLAGVVFPNAYPLFALAILLVGLAEFGWAAELLPRQSERVAGWARAARWLCALLGTLLAVICLALNLTPVAWLGFVIAVTGVLLSLEMAPYGPANRP